MRFPTPRMPAWALPAVMALSLGTVPLALGQAHHHDASAEAPGWTTTYRGLEFPVSTQSAEAQRLVEQGLLLLYAFNHEAAEAAFARAVVLDPQLAMAHWGIALAVGPYFNAPMDAERNRRGHQAIGQALVRLDGASERERDYIQALAERYSDGAGADLRQQQQRYAAAMRALADRYPDDLDAAVLYAESRMVLNPWRLWEEDGRPADGTEDIVAVLESVLRRAPDHVGANHLYIHAVEASPQPERALAAAQRLEALGLDAGHLAHMPGHIYLRTGDYAAVIRSNLAAVAADEAFAAGEHTVSPRQAGYALHNLEFVLIASVELGLEEQAVRLSSQFDAAARARTAENPAAGALLARHRATLLRLGLWQDVLALAEPGSALPMARAFDQYARGIAHAAVGDPARAIRAQRRFIEALAGVDAAASFRGNPAGIVLSIASHVLDARIAVAQGRHDDAIAALRLAVAVQDGLNYDEPASWDFPVRELLGATLLHAGRAGEAEAVFRQNLRRQPRHPRSLSGLAQSLHAQGRGTHARLVERQLGTARSGVEAVLARDPLWAQALQPDR